MLAGEGISKGAFFGMIILFFALSIANMFLSGAQIFNIELSGMENSNEEWWFYRAYYYKGVFTCLGAILIGQFKRCDKEMTTLLPKPTRNEIIQPVVSIFLAEFFMRMSLTFYWGYDRTYNLWNFSPFCMFFMFLASSTHKLLGIRQGPKDMFAIACITTALFLFLAGIADEYQPPFNFWCFFFCLLSTISFTHFFTKEEYILKRRQITVFELLDLQGQRVLGLYLIAIFITSIIDWYSHDFWTPAIYFMAVFSSFLNVFLTAMMPVASGIISAVILVIIFNSSSIRFWTIVLLPSSIVALILIGSESGMAIAASCLLAVGVILYNLSGNCGRESIEEYRAEQRQLMMDEQEAVFFKAEAVVAPQVVYQEQMYAQPMQQPMMQQNFAVNQMV